MQLAALTEIIQPLALEGSGGAEIKGVTADSRRVRPGWLFVAVPGHARDGGAYIPDALARGAAAIVSEGPLALPRGIAHVHVADARQALAELACAHHGDPAAALRLVGITGTNGKTTVSFMVQALLAAAGQQPGLIGTIHYELGARRIPARRTTPDAADLQDLLAAMRTAGCQSAVMEVSSHALDQKRVWGVDFDVAVFTNLSQDHLDYHGDLERYFAAKALLFRGLGQKAKTAVAVINLDDAWGQRLLQIAAPRVGHVAYGFHPNAQVRAADYRPTATGSICAFETPWGGGQLELPLPGAFNVSNALAALATAGALGLDPVWAAAILAQMPPVPGRLEAIPHPGGPRVFVDYAHTPDALAQVLQTLRETTVGRLWVVFGCGGNRDRGKRPLMGALAAQYADHVVITSDNPRSEDPAQIAAEIAAGLPPGVNAQLLLDRAVAIHQTLHAAQPADTVLIAGKGHEAYQELADCVKPFDDREVARAILNPPQN